MQLVDVLGPKDGGNKNKLIAPKHCLPDKVTKEESWRVWKEDFEEPEKMEIVIDCSKIKPTDIEDDSDDINDLLGIGN